MLGHRSIRTSITSFKRFRMAGPCRSITYPIHTLARSRIESTSFHARAPISPMLPRNDFTHIASSTALRMLSMQPWRTMKKKGLGQRKSKSPNLNQLVGPTGRPALVDGAVYEEIVKKLRSDAKVATTQLHNAKQSMGFDLEIQHQLIDSTRKHEPLFLVTLTVNFPEAEDLQPYLDSLPNPHYVVQEDGSLQLVCSGAAPSKKKAMMMASTDALAMFQEIGIDAERPPNFRKLYTTRVEKQRRAEEKEAMAKARQTYKRELARAQMILELMNTPRPVFTVQQVDGANNTWTAEASLYFRGNSITVTGPPGERKAEAEGNALIELVKSAQLEEVAGNSLASYQDLIDRSPGGHVASLRIPSMGDEWLEEFHQAVGTQEDQDMRARLHAMAKEEYEFKMRAKEERLADRREQSTKWQERSHHKQRIEEMLSQEELRRQAKAMKPNSAGSKMKSIRDALPIKKIQGDLIESLKDRQVIVVSGGTGSGKSTQCPQYILEDALANGRGADTNIIVTQPRKIAAVSVAERVAAERGESIGHAVGYSVRFNRKAPRDHGSVEFVTTGVLLRRLINSPTLPGISHVMIDEVHERDIQTDFLLVLLRDLLKTRPDLRVVLMSATLDADSFGEYFADLKSDEVAEVRVLKVPTQPRHPVEVLYLENLIEASDTSQSKLKKLATALLQHNDHQLQMDLEEALDEEEAGRRLATLSRREDEGDALDSSSDSESDSDDEEVSQTGSKERKARIETLRRALSLRTPGGQVKRPSDSDFDPRDAVVEILCETVVKIASEESAKGRDGSILCFLPGWDEIKAATEKLEELSGRLRNLATILPLHSTIPHEDQKKVFEPANGKMKIILATNIAESSVTIDDVLAVVDSGLVREMNFDPSANMTAMETNKTSQASATQRLGRAGRVAPGKCYRLYSRGDFEVMPARPTPEIQRTALEATCLQTCSMTSTGVESFLAQAMDPPPNESVSLAMKQLVSLGAIEIVDDGEKLSPLGRCLSGLPLDPATGKMLIMGALFGCLDPTLTTAACFSSKNVFYNPPGFRDTALRIRRSFSKDSDIDASLQAYNSFWQRAEDEGWEEAKHWAYDNYISITAMTGIKAVRSQLLDELHKAGIVATSDLKNPRSRKSIQLVENASVNENVDISKLYSAIWATAFPSNLASRRTLGSFGTLRTRMDSHSGLHPSSVGFYRKPPQDAHLRRNLPKWYLYQEMVLSSQLFLRGSSAIDPEQVLLFGGYDLESGRDDSNVHAVLDEWIAVEGCSETVQKLAMARSAIDEALEQMVMQRQISARNKEILDCVADFLNSEPV